MKNSNSEVKNELVTIPKTNNQKGIDNHLKAAEHLDNASKHHIEAAKHHEAGNHEKAAQSTITAHGFVNLASKAQKKDAKLHAVKG